MSVVSEWRAPRAASPVDATVSLPGSKSMTARALVIGALADGRTEVHGPLRSRDTSLMTTALRALGAAVDDRSDACWTVDGPVGRVGTGSRAVAVDVGLAGTVARFVPPLAALVAADVRFDGDARMRDRPMAPLLGALRELGVAVTADGDRLPLTIHGTGAVSGSEVDVDASASSQLVSGLLLAAPCFAGGLRLRQVGPTMPSRPHVEMTVAMMRAAGAEVDETAPATWVVGPGGYRASRFVVEPDISGASAFLAAAVATGGVVRVPGWPRTTTQPGDRLLDLLTRMGAHAAIDDGGLVVRGPVDVRGIDADLRDCPEMTPAIAALAVLADGPSRLTGVAHIRGQETDRITALAVELGRLGADVEELPDGLVISPRRLRGACLRAYGDHRLAMAWAVVGLVVDDVTVDDVTTTAKTMPDFVERWSAMLDGAPTSEPG